MNLLDLMIKVGIEDQASGGLDKIVGNVKTAAEGIKKGLSTALGVSTKIATVTGSAITAVTGLALKANGELEQNIGGAQQVFGNFSNDITEMSQDVYKNMGLSAQSFLATANQMGALLQGSGFSIKESATMAVDVMQRASDVASIMGIDVTQAMQAVAGAAKGNFTMMDNLGVAINDNTIAQYAMAKGITKSTREMTTQEKVGLALELFMERTAYATGNYARENETLAGSLTTAKAALENFLAGTIRYTDFADTLSNTARVIVENIQRIVPDITEGIGIIAEQLAPEIPKLFEAVLPAIVDGTKSLLSGFTTILPELVQVVLDSIPLFVSAVGEIGKAMGEAFKETGGILLTAFVDVFQRLTGIDLSGVVEKIRLFGANVRGALGSQEFKNAVERVGELMGAFKENVWPIIERSAVALKDLGLAIIEFYSDKTEKTIGFITNLFEPFKEALPKIVDKVAEAIKKFFTALGEMDLSDSFFKVIDSITKLFAPFVSNLPGVIERAGEAIEAFIKFFGEVATGPITTIADAIVKMLSPFTDALPGFITDVFTAIRDLFDKAQETGLVDTMQKLAEGVALLFSPFGVALGEWVTLAGEAFKAFVNSIDKDDVENFKLFADALEKILKFLKGLIQAALDTVTAFGKMVVGLIQAKDDVGKQLDAVKQFFIDSFNASLEPWEGIGGKFSEIVNAIKAPFAGLVEWAFGIGKGMMEGLQKGIDSVKGFLHEKFPNIFYDLEDKAEEATEINSPSKVYERIGAYMMEGLAVGWKKSYDSLSGGMTDTLHALENGMHYAYVRSGDSLVSQNTKAAVNANLAAISGLADSNEKSINVNLIMDGQVMASALVEPFSKEMRRAGKGVVAKAY